MLLECLHLGGQRLHVLEASRHLLGRLADLQEQPGIVVAHPGGQLTQGGANLGGGFLELVDREVPGPLDVLRSLVLAEGVPDQQSHHLLRRSAFQAGAGQQRAHPVHLLVQGHPDVLLHQLGLLLEGQLQDVGGHHLPVLQAVALQDVRAERRELDPRLVRHQLQLGGVVRFEGHGHPLGLLAGPASGLRHAPAYAKKAARIRNR